MQTWARRSLSPCAMSLPGTPGGRPSRSRPRAPGAAEDTAARDGSRSRWRLGRQSRCSKQPVTELPVWVSRERCLIGWIVLTANLLKQICLRDCRTLYRSMTPCWSSMSSSTWTTTVAALQQLGRLLNRSGRPIVSVPALPEFFSEFDEVQGHRRRYIVEVAAWLPQGVGSRDRRHPMVGTVDGPPAAGEEVGNAQAAGRYQRRCLQALSRTAALARTLGYEHHVPRRSLADDWLPKRDGEVFDTRCGTGKF
jgi:hypothetical protein